MIILIMIACSVLAIEIAYESTLAYDIKKYLRIDQSPSIVLVLAKFQFWNKLLTKWLFPINLVFSTIFSIYNKMIQMINCAYCLTFHLTTWILFILGNGLFDSIVYGLIAIPITHIIERIYGN